MGQKDTAQQENARRANMGKAAIAAGSQRDEPETELTDTLANIMHYAAREGLDFNYALDSAINHFDYEVMEAQS